MGASTIPQGFTPATAGFTCNSCCVRFVSADLQRQHMKTEWHRYNLKRRVSGLPLISSDVFAEKVLATQSSAHSSDEEEDEYGFYINHRRRAGKGQRQITKKELRQMARVERGREPNISEVEVLRGVSPAASLASTFSLGESDHFLSEGDFDTGSELNYSETDSYYTGGVSDTDELYMSGSDSEIEEPLEVLPNHYCFYCDKNNHLIEANVRHMLNTHGLYIPERTYLKDLDGLLTFLNEVISIDHECLTCGFEGKSLESIRQHMISKGHCRMPYESKEEKEIFEEFYDFSLASALPDSAGTKKRVTFSDERGPLDYTLVEVEDSPNYTPYSRELVLPSGSRILHRESRQPRLSVTSLVPRDVPELTKTVALVDRRFAPGLTLLDVAKQEKDVQRIEQRARNIHERRKKTKKVNYQAHFRDELLQ